MWFIWFIQLVSWADVAGGLQCHDPTVHANASQSHLVVFNENSAHTSCPPEPKFEVWAAPPTSHAKENEQKPEKWCDVKV